MEKNEDYVRAQNELIEATENLENAKKLYKEKLEACLIPPLDIDAIHLIQNSELMQIKVRNDNLLCGSFMRSNYSSELMEKLYEMASEIEFYDETGESKDYVFDQLSFKKCEYFLDNHHFSVYEMFKFMEIASKDYVSNLARDKAYKRLENDPKQQALDEIFQHYETNKHQFKRRGYTAQFVREMHDKYPIITSIKTIENLVTSLNKENEFIPR